MKIKFKGKYTITLSDEEARQLYKDISKLSLVLYEGSTTLSDVNEQWTRSGGLDILLELKSSLGYLAQQYHN